ncbi:MAG: class I SAM-dependent methyltransferase [Candidatus Bathyarchaeia archaeon]
MIKILPSDYSYAPYFHKPEIDPWVLGILKKLKKSKILDIGTGLGFWGFIIKHISPKCLSIGVDISKEALIKLKGFNIYDSLICADARYLPLKEKVFDLLISVEAVHRFLTKELLLYYEKVLNSKGAILFVFPTEPNLTNILLDLGYNVYGVFFGGFLTSGTCILLNVKTGGVITRQTKSITILSSALLLRIIYSLFKLRLIRYCIAIKQK